MGRFIDKNLNFITLDDGICNQCKHRIMGGLNCKAFPDGISDDILRGIADHRFPIAGDRGIRFELLSHIEEELKK